MNPAALLRLDVRQLLARARRNLVGVIGWALLASGAIAVVTPIPFAIPVFLAGAALLDETNPKISRAIGGIVSATRHYLVQLGHTAHDVVRGVRGPRFALAR
jgi:hypothetical protein